MGWSEEASETYICRYCFQTHFFLFRSCKNYFFLLRPRSESSQPSQPRHPIRPVTAVHFAVCHPGRHPTQSRLGQVTQTKGTCLKMLCCSLLLLCTLTRTITRLFFFFSPFCTCPTQGYSSRHTGNAALQMHCITSVTLNVIIHASFTTP